MDLISKEAIKKRIWWHSIIQKDIDSMPSAFEGMTNGEVLKSIFPYAEIVGGDETLTAVRIDTKDGTPIVLYTEWLNALYQKGGE